MHTAMGCGDLAEPAPSPVFVVRQHELATLRVCPAQAAGLLSVEHGGQIRIAEQLPADLACGYHQLASDDGEARLVIVTPGVCHIPQTDRWGWAAQLYASRSHKSWGMGDLADLRRLARWSASVGAQSLLINPLGAVAPAFTEPAPTFPRRGGFKTRFTCISKTCRAHRCWEANSTYSLLLGGN